MLDYYQILGISPSASQMQLVNEAYGVLLINAPEENYRNRMLANAMVELVYSTYLVALHREEKHREPP